MELINLILDNYQFGYGLLALVVVVLLGRYLRKRMKRNQTEEVREHEHLSAGS